MNFTKKAKARIEEIEGRTIGDRSAFFFIMGGKATGTAYWRNDLRWENLSKPEFEKLTAELEADGVKLYICDMRMAIARGVSVSGWECPKEQAPESNSDEAPEQA